MDNELNTPNLTSETPEQPEKLGVEKNVEEALYAGTEASNPVRAKDTGAAPTKSLPKVDLFTAGEAPAAPLETTSTTTTASTQQRPAGEKEATKPARQQPQGTEQAASAAGSHSSQTIWPSEQESSSKVQAAAKSEIRSDLTNKDTVKTFAQSEISADLPPKTNLSSEVQTVTDVSRLNGVKSTDAPKITAAVIQPQPQDLRSEPAGKITAGINEDRTTANVDQFRPNKLIGEGIAPKQETQRADLGRSEQINREPAGGISATVGGAERESLSTRQNNKELAPVNAITTRPTADQPAKEIEAIRENKNIYAAADGVGDLPNLKKTYSVSQPNSEPNAWLKDQFADASARNPAATGSNDYKGNKIAAYQSSDGPQSVTESRTNKEKDTWDLRPNMTATSFDPALGKLKPEYQFEGKPYYGSSNPNSDRNAQDKFAAGYTDASVAKRQMADQVAAAVNAGPSERKTVDTSSYAAPGKYETASPKDYASQANSATYSDRASKIQLGADGDAYRPTNSMSTAPIKQDWSTAPGGEGGADLRRSATDAGTEKPTAFYGGGKYEKPEPNAAGDKQPPLLSASESSSHRLSGGEPRAFDSSKLTDPSARTPNANSDGAARQVDVTRGAEGSSPSRTASSSGEPRQDATGTARSEHGAMQSADTHWQGRNNSAHAEQMVRSELPRSMEQNSARTPESAAQLSSRREEERRPDIYVPQVAPSRTESSALAPVIPPAVAQPGTLARTSSGDAAINVLRPSSPSDARASGPVIDGRLPLSGMDGRAIFSSESKAGTTPADGRVVLAADGRAILPGDSRTVSSTDGRGGSILPGADGRSNAADTRGGALLDGRVVISQDGRLQSGLDARSGAAQDGRTVIAQDGRLPSGLDVRTGATIDGRVGGLTQDGRIASASNDGRQSGLPGSPLDGRNGRQEPGAVRSDGVSRNPDAPLSIGGARGEQPGGRDLDTRLPGDRHIHQTGTRVDADGVIRIGPAIITTSGIDAGKGIKDPLTGRLSEHDGEEILEGEDGKITIGKIKGERRFILGVELAIAGLLTVAATARHRSDAEELLNGNINPDSLLPDVQLSEDDGTDPDRQEIQANAVLTRRNYMIMPGDTLPTIAERFYRDSSLGWLIADLNSGAIKESNLDGKRVVELACRQVIELPDFRDVQAFRGKHSRNVDHSAIVTIVTENSVDKELLQSFLGRVTGDATAAIKSTPATNKAPVSEPAFKLKTTITKPAQLAALLKRLPTTVAAITQGNRRQATEAAQSS